MKAVMLSTRPTYVADICTLKKKFDVRKNKPKIDCPFKCLIYCSKDSSKGYLHIIEPNGRENPNIISAEDGDIVFDKIKGHKNCLHIANDLSYAKYINYNCINGKVVGEFICDYILKLNAELYSDNKVFNAIKKYDEDGDIETIISNEDFEADNDWLNYEIPDTSVNIKQLIKYLGLDSNPHYAQDKDFYLWHISYLKIYDSPLLISDFHTPCENIKNCMNKNYRQCGHELNKCSDCGCELRKAPQSWCYVED